MILAYFVVLATIVSYLTGGRLRSIPEHDLRGFFLPIAAFAIEAAAPILASWLPYPPASWHWCSISVEYALLLFFCSLNRRNKPFFLIFSGVLLNLAVIAANGFRMPVTPIVYEMPQLASYVARIQSGELFEYVLTGYDAPLWFLGDTIALPFLGIGLASAGDFLLAGGVGWLIFKLMRPPIEKKNVEL